MLVKQLAFLVLHPAYKLQLFKTQGWEPEWIEVAEELVRDEWDAHYNPRKAYKASGHRDPSSGSTLHSSSKTRKPRPGHRSAQATAALGSTSKASVSKLLE